MLKLTVVRSTMNPALLSLRSRDEVPLKEALIKSGFVWGESVVLIREKELEEIQRALDYYIARP